MRSPRLSVQPAQPAPPEPSQRLPHDQRHQQQRHAWLGGVHSWTQELSGSLGDLGTFLPLVVALSASAGLDLGTTLVMSGLYNIGSGLAFRIPMCVQPMKTVAAVALAAPGAMSLSEVMAAGLFVGGTMLLLGVCGLMDLFDRACPGSLVRGIQLAVGLQLAQKGISQACLTSAGAWRGVWGVEGLLLGLVSSLLLLVTTMAPAAAAETAAAAAAGGSRLVHEQQQQQQQQQQHDEEAQQLLPHQQQQQQQQLEEGDDTGGSGCDTTHAPGAAAAAGAGAAAAAAAEQLAAGCGGCGGAADAGGAVPSALVAVCVGLLLAVAAHPEVLTSLRLGPTRPTLYLPAWPAWRGGVLKAGLAQLPLTSLNSVVAVCQLAAALFPARAAAEGWRWRPRGVAMSVGAMNLAGCWLGAFPCCHGSGGLAAQYKFGARSGAAPVLLGGIKLALGLAFGSSLLALLAHFPAPLLGAMLLVSGLELAASARKEGGGAHGYALMLLTAAAILGLRNTATGFAVGAAGCGALAAYERACAWAPRAALLAWRRWRLSKRRGSAGGGGPTVAAADEDRGAAAAVVYGGVGASEDDGKV